MDTPSRPAVTTDTLYEHAACGLLLTEADGTIIGANATFCGWVGYAREELVARRRVQDLLTIGGRVFHQTHWLPLLTIQGSVAEVKLDMVRHDGEKIPMLLNAVSRSHGGAIRHELAVFVATDRHKYERELVNARTQLNALNDQLREADRRKDEFLATLAHELRNPLAPVRNVLQIMQQQPLDASRTAWALSVLDRQVRHMTRLVDDLMEISRITQGKIELRKTRLELTGVVRACGESAAPLMQAAGHELTLSFPVGRIYVEADETRLSQIIQNLLNNAAKFTPKGGKIVLSVARSGDSALIKVRDSGVGIARENLAGIFEMFSQVDSSRERSQGGLGIGLALVRALVQLHGGTITAESAGTDAGSEFVVQLPVVAPPEQSLQSTIAERFDQDRPGRRVLIVDDNEDSLQSLALLLQLRGHQVRCAASGTEALRMASEFTPDLLIIDIGLPDMNGYQVARQLRAEPWGRSPVIVALTGWSQPQDKQAAVDAGFDHHYTKPLAPADLDSIMSAATGSE